MKITREDFVALYAGALAGQISLRLSITDDDCVGYAMRLALMAADKLAQMPQEKFDARYGVVAVCPDRPEVTPSDGVK